MSRKEQKMAQKIADTPFQQAPPVQDPPVHRPVPMSWSLVSEKSGERTVAVQVRGGCIVRVVGESMVFVRGVKLSELQGR